MGHVDTKYVKIIAGSMFSTPIVVGWILGWCTQYECQRKPDQTIEIIQSSWTVLDTLLILSSLTSSGILGTISVYAISFIILSSIRITTI